MSSKAKNQEPRIPSEYANCERNANREKTNRRKRGKIRKQKLYKD